MFRPIIQIMGRPKYKKELLQTDRASAFVCRVTENFGKDRERG